MSKNSEGFIFVFRHSEDVFGCSKIAYCSFESLLRRKCDESHDRPVDSVFVLLRVSVNLLFNQTNTLSRLIHYYHLASFGQKIYHFTVVISKVDG